MSLLLFIISAYYLPGSERCIESPQLRCCKRRRPTGPEGKPQGPPGDQDDSLLDGSTFEQFSYQGGAFDIMSSLKPNEQWIRL